MSKKTFTRFILFFSALTLLTFLGVKTQAINLKVKYFENIPRNIELDDKYYQPDKYLIYKYLHFQFDQQFPVSSVKVKFVVDKNWYKKNKIKDVVFLHYEDGHWKRIGYQSKSNSGSYIVYEVLSQRIEGYWVIIGVLPEMEVANGKIDLGLKTDGSHFKDIKLPNYLGSVNKIKQKIDSVIKDPVKVKGASAIVNATATASLLALLVSVNGLFNLLLIFGQTLTSLFGLFSKYKDYKKGLIYDAETGEPISLARVDLMNNETGRVQATKFTDKNGMYYFLAPQGKFHLKVYKRGYKVIDLDKMSFLRNIIKKEDTEPNIELKKPGIIKKNIAILREGGEISGFRWTKLLFKEKIWQTIFDILFYLGFAFNIWSTYSAPKLFNFIVFGFYIVILIFKLTFTGKVRSGKIVNESGKPEPFAIVKVIDPENKKIISRAITNTKGNYYMALEPGEYLLEIETNKGVRSEGRIKVYDAGVLTKKIVIHPTGI